MNDQDLQAAGLVTIIIPVFNRSLLLRQAVESALRQTYRPIEVVIVDDGSNDDTPSTITELTSLHAEVRGIRRDNGGPGAARESGRLVSRGEFLQYLDSDDLLLPAKLELQVAALRRDISSGVCYGRTRYRDAENCEIACSWKPLLNGETTILPHFLAGRLWETAAPLYRRVVTDATGPWTERRLEEDWEYDCRIGSLGVRLAFVPEVVAEHRDVTGTRLSRGAALDQGRLRDRAAAHSSVYASARRAGVGNESAGMARFARSLFLLSRQCGAAGLLKESGNLLRLALEASSSADIRAYRAAARVLGLSAMGKLAGLVDRCRASRA